jgi:hypothetical protein
MKSVCSKEDVQTILDPFSTTPSFIKYAEDAKTKDAVVCGKDILANGDLARALLKAETMNRSVIKLYLNTHQI